MPAIAINVYKGKWLAYLTYSDYPEDPGITIKVIYPYRKMEMRAIPYKIIICYNLVTTNNACKMCSKNNKV